ncbi:precorrin-6A reductase [Hungatella sp.]|uniref:precorrin-6A reductase n=1 Tax=Hungatella sp. TaxID=2613924 RepID=UPI002A826E69|nr:precorrin-6A reductase [Hungatella sp.]
MCRILIFGGTTEGRLLAEYCHQQEIEAYVSVVSGYGADLLPESEYLHVLSGRMAGEAMEGFMKRASIRAVFDATHPYAAEATRNIKEACSRAGVSYLRITRESAAAENPGGDSGKGSAAAFASQVVYVHSVEEAVCYLKDREGDILVTTGSKELAAYTALPGYEERLYVRVLPSCAAISACEDIGIRGKRIIAMQGPFSEEMNRAMMRQLGVRYLVTKEAGTAGGFLEKLSAADALSVTAVVIGRPLEEGDGITLDAAKILLKEAGTVSAKRKLSLIGTGMGGPGQMTLAAAEALKRCDVLFGARRMTDAAETLGEAASKILRVPIYGNREILEWLESHPEHKRAGVLYSGDTGFYSGASGMAAVLSEKPHCDSYEFTIYPGISSVSYLCAKMGRSWEHVKLISLHGRDCDAAQALAQNPAVFTLLGGAHTVKELCEQLLRAGLTDVRITAGERLSYADERIVTGTPDQLATMEFTSLAVVLMERNEESEGVR